MGEERKYVKKVRPPTFLSGIVWEGRGSRGGGVKDLWEMQSEEMLEPEPRLPQVGTDPYGTNAALGYHSRFRDEHRSHHHRILLARAGMELLFLM